MDVDGATLWVTIPGRILLALAGPTTMIGTLGLLRLRDFFQRMHRLSMTNTLASGAALIASMLVSSALAGSRIIYKLLITLFVSMGAPVTASMLLQAALCRSKARHSGDVTADGDGD